MCATSWWVSHFSVTLFDAQLNAKDKSDGTNVSQHVMYSRACAWVELVDVSVCTRRLTGGVALVQHRNSLVSQNFGNAHLGRGPNRLELGVCLCGSSSAS